MDGREFIKMHGLGNDFVIIDARGRPLALAPEDARRVADRRTGVGCDQVIVIDPPAAGAGLDATFRIHNADGGEVAACGNATRCVAWLVMGETGRDTARLATGAGPLAAERAGPGRIRIDMGRPAFDWQSIPLAGPCDTDALPVEDGPLRAPSAVSMGNPHAVFFVADAAAVDLAAIGPRLEHHPIFPERANIGVVQVLDRARLRVRVWERGAGLTLACGTGACAAAVSAARRGLADRRVETLLDGGSLEIEWRADDHVMMTGPVAVSFRGRMDGALLA